ncbi:LysR family transcriptional regulator [Sandaracinus amylolyticus]|uniref:Transcriptional regulator, LysR family protein n=1 Tax=Sandaracinus amylolyticus TaxID=927083 RepID=A0A0F6SH02_9BACT|nr:LysR family transcriptional regulator [Sandaracinus amylolyticus]AKF09589.1 transcriptional regulator, LysR family protein [Sandaracinus amylolyticus]
MDWDDVRHFLALARARSVRAAGAALGVSHSTVARRVEALEARLGVKLFDRHRDGYLLTDAGHEMVAGAERVEREMATLERGVAGQDARLEGAIRVTCTDPFIAKILVRSLASLCERHPGIELELSADAKYLDLSKREADVALRALALGASPPEHLIGRRLVPIVLCSYVGKAHAGRLDPDRGGGPTRWLGSNLDKVMQELVGSSSHPDVPLWGTFESMAVMIEAAHAGLGLIMVPTYAGDPDPELERLAKPDLRHVGDFWLLGHRDLRDNARLRAAREVITRGLLERLPLFRGEGDGWSENATLRTEVAPSARRARS